MRYADTYGRYELTPLPGCPNVAVSHGVIIYEEFRGQGRGRIQHEGRLSQARSLGYSYIICTVRSNNHQELKILEKQGWKKLDWFWHADSKDYNIEVWGKTL